MPVPVPKMPIMEGQTASKDAGIGMAGGLIEALASAAEGLMGGRPQSKPLPVWYPARTASAWRCVGARSRGAGARARRAARVARMAPLLGRAGTIGERKNGSRPSLLTENRTREMQWRPAASALVQLRNGEAAEWRRSRTQLRATRRMIRRSLEVLIRQDFGYRFAMAMRETCMARRQAAIAQLISEQEAELRRLIEAALAEERADKEPCRPPRARRFASPAVLAMAGSREGSTASPPAAPARAGPPPQTLTSENFHQPDEADANISNETP